MVILDHSISPIISNYGYMDWIHFKKVFTAVFIYLLFKITGIRRSKADEEILHGTDWESVNYSLTKLRCNEDEITGKLLCLHFCQLFVYNSLQLQVYVSVIST